MSASQGSSSLRLNGCPRHRLADGVLTAELDNEKSTLDPTLIDPDKHPNRG